MFEPIRFRNGKDPRHILRNRPSILQQSVVTCADFMYNNDSITPRYYWGGANSIRRRNAKYLARVLIYREYRERHLVYQSIIWQGLHFTRIG